MMYVCKRSFQEAWNDLLLEQERLEIIQERLLLRYENLKIEKRIHVKSMNKTVQRYENTILKLELRMEKYVSNLEEKCKKLDDLQKKYTDIMKFANEARFLRKENESLIKVIKNLEFQEKVKPKHRHYDHTERLEGYNLMTSSKGDDFAGLEKHVDDTKGYETKNGDNSKQIKRMEEEWPTDCFEESIANIVPQNVEIEEHQERNHSFRKPSYNTITIVAMHDSEDMASKSKESSYRLLSQDKVVRQDDSMKNGKTNLLEMLLEENTSKIIDFTLKIEKLEKNLHDYSLERQAHLSLLKSLHQKIQVLQQSDVDHLAFQARDEKEMITWVDFLIKRSQQRRKKKEMNHR